MGKLVSVKSNNRLFHRITKCTMES